MMETYDYSNAVFDSFGLLEHIFSFSGVNDLVSATAVNRRWKEAGRSDFLWKRFCQVAYERGLGMAHLDGEGGTPLFWRPALKNEAIEKMSVREIRGLFDHFLLSERRAQLRACLQKSEMIHLLKVYRDEHNSHLTIRFPDLWFGSYCSCVSDAKRNLITKEELCNPYGFDMYFKILEEEVWDEADMSELIHYESHPGVMLYHHSVCYFDADNEFDMEMKEQGAYQPTGLQWRWEGHLVQVGPYPHLLITRLSDGRWKLENVHVCLFFRDSRASFSQRR